MSQSQSQEPVVLLPCPFCGDTPRYALGRTCEKDTPYDASHRAFPVVRCKCGAEVPGKNWSHERTAIAAWNRRVVPADDQTPQTHENDLAVGRDGLQHDAGGARSSPTPVPSTGEKE